MDSRKRRSNVLRFSTRFVIAYTAYLIFLGPFWAVYGRGWFPIPRVVGDAVFLPTYPVFTSEFGSCLYGQYLDTWYDDPNAYETTGCL
jgi:hypothetical protein